MGWERAKGWVLRKARCRRVRGSRRELRWQRVRRLLMHWQRLMVRACLKLQRNQRILRRRTGQHWPKDQRSQRDRRWRRGQRIQMVHLLPKDQQSQTGHHSQTARQNQKR